jgi:hypothetical protein
MKKLLTDEAMLAAVRARIATIPNPVSDEDEELVRKLYGAMRSLSTPPRDWGTIIRNISLTLSGIGIAIGQLFAGL